MKKLLSILLLFASVNLFAQDLPFKLHIPKKYNDYNLKEIDPVIFNLQGRHIFAKLYDINEDGMPDVSEMYPILSYETGNQIRRTLNPLFYAFDFNENHRVDYNELILDEEMDGLNGNEKWLSPGKSIPQKYEQDYSGSVA